MCRSFSLNFSATSGYRYFTRRNGNLRGLFHHISKLTGDRRISPFPFVKAVSINRISPPACVQASPVTTPGSGSLPASGHDAIPLCPRNSGTRFSLTVMRLLLTAVPAAQPHICTAYPSAFSVRGHLPPLYTPQSFVRIASICHLQLFWALIPMLFIAFGSR